MIWFLFGRRLTAGGVSTRYTSIAWLKINEMKRPKSLTLLPDRVAVDPAFLGLIGKGRHPGGMRSRWCR